MKTIIVVSLVMFISASCTWDNAEDLYGKTDCPPGITFNAHIQPIINTNCAVSGCHIQGQQYPPLTSYDEVFAVRDRVKKQTSTGSMPPASSGRSLTKAEIDMIACWVDDGGPEK